MPETGKQRIQSETEYLERQRQGGVVVTVGKLLLWIDLILACFVYDGLQAGSHLYLWWVIGQFIVGAALLGAGWRVRSEAGHKLLELSPKLTSRDAQTEAEQERRVG